MLFSGTAISGSRKPESPMAIRKLGNIRKLGTVPDNVNK